MNEKQVSSAYLKLNPDPLGPQHDEREPGYLGGRFKWTEGLRRVEGEAILHASVLARFATADGVQHFSERTDYRPSNLRNHAKSKQSYLETPSDSEDGRM